MNADRFLRYLKTDLQPVQGSGWMKWSMSHIGSGPPQAKGTYSIKATFVSYKYVKLLLCVYLSMCFHMRNAFIRLMEAKYDGF